MKQYFVNKSDTKRLNLVFLGYGQDERPFLYLKNQSEDSLALVYDYTNRNFDPDVFDGFDEICLIAWSMGVMAAPKVLNKYALLKKVKISTAINGTLEGIDDTLGIPLSMWQATIDALDEKNAVKFYRRMCSDKLLFCEYMVNRPDRSVDSLKAELEALIPFSREPLVSDFVYDSTIVGKKDKIFSPRNVIRSCDLHRMDVIESEYGHYSKDDFYTSFIIQTSALRLKQR